MQKSFTLFAFVAFLSVISCTKNKKSQETKDSPELTFGEFEKITKSVNFSAKDFPNEKKWNGNHAKPIFDTDSKKNYRTLILQESNAEPNFNGIYRIIEFSAGSSWHGFFVLNLETGEISEGVFHELSLEYSVDSALIVVDSAKDVLEYWSGSKTVPARAMTRYLLYKENAFVQLAKTYGEIE